jgi:hypothetical protein
LRKWSPTGERPSILAVVAVPPVWEELYVSKKRKPAVEEAFQNQHRATSLELLMGTGPEVVV